ncbi:MAG: hypothetical protein K6D59_07450 [Bacteroidales bacterium]|nr:hypothetical protein [Bacteroidales bacterium]
MPSTVLGSEPLPPVGRRQHKSRLLFFGRQVFGSLIKLTRYMFFYSSVLAGVATAGVATVH